ncbi:MAG: hypothetical protein FJ090_14370 [Deltaproteobacteria bacterium]|nr:hypothetical protein [Deltaproteobacteria bacterium]
MPSPKRTGEWNLGVAVGLDDTVADGAAEDRRATRHVGDEVDDHLAVDGGIVAVDAHDEGLHLGQGGILRRDLEGLWRAGEEQYGQGDNEQALYDREGIDLRGARGAG